MTNGDARRRGDDDLPPDPWGGLAGTPPPSPPPSTPPPLPPGPGAPGWGDPRQVPGDPGDPAASHPAFSGGERSPGAERGHVPPPRRTIWHHPAVWVALLVLAGLLLLGALLERPTTTPSSPSPDSVTAVAPLGT